MLATYATAHFQLMHATAPAQAEALGQRLETLLSRFRHTYHEAGFVTHPPSHPLSWLFIERPEDYENLVAAETSAVVRADEAWYSSRSDTVVLLRRPEEHELPAGSCRISHEAAHQLAYNVGLQKRGVLYPLWLNEGLATHFETAAATFAGDNPERRSGLARAYRAQQLYALEKVIIVVTAGEDHERDAVLYAQSWGLVQFLYQRDPSRFREYLYLLALRPPGERPAASLQREFASSFGTVAELEPAWQRFLAGLSLDNPPAPTKASDLMQALAATTGPVDAQCTSPAPITKLP